MGKYLQFIILSAFLGNPILAGLILIGVWWGADHYTFGFLPDPVRIVRRWQRGWVLERQLLRNPHDRRSRVELADLKLSRRQYGAALALLRVNLEAGDDDSNTLYLMGVACLGAGHPSQGEVFLEGVEAASPKFRMGVVALEQGRWRLARGEAKGALEPLEAFCQMRPGSVEGKVLLARAHAALGDDVKAAYLNRDAWREYASAPRFKRRAERWWAWRAQPRRPATVALVLLLCAVLFGTFAAPTLTRTLSHFSTRPAAMAEPWGD